MKEVAGTARIVRNGRLLADSVVQHLRDDPALLAIQISRRLPMQVRVRIGQALHRYGTRLDGSGGIAALGAVMSGVTGHAAHILEQRARSTARLAGEVAVLVGRTDLVGNAAAAATRARARWAEGDLSGAVTILEDAGRGGTPQARRLRSELDLLTDGYALPQPPTRQLADPPRAGERMRVLHLLTNSLPHTQSGYAVRTHNILTSLREHGIDSLALTRTGYPVMVGKLFCADEDLVDGVRYRRTLPPVLADTPQGRLEQEVEEAMRLVEDFRPHVLHATTDYRNALVARAVSAATGIPWVFEVRGLLEKTWIASRGSDENRARAARSEKVRLLARAEAGLARSADAVVTLSRTMADELTDRGVPDCKITLVPNGVDRSLLDEELNPAQARARLGDVLSADALAVGAISALVGYEGYDTLLRAVSRMIADDDVPSHIRDRVYVVLVGDGVSAPGLHALAAELGIHDRVIMPGRVPRDQARTWVQALDAVVVPRRDLEVARTVTPQKPVEAMALHRPVVVSDLPALRETIQDEAGDLTGVLAPPDDPAALAAALAELLADTGRREALARRGRAAAAQRMWPSLMTRYEAVYGAAIRSASRSI